MRRRTHKDRYIQALRHASAGPADTRTVHALDLEVSPVTHIDTTSHIPTIAAKKPLPRVELQGESKIPGIRKPAEHPKDLNAGKQKEELWTKGDLLDSLDLSSTKVRDKLTPFLEKLKEAAESDKAWLGQSIRDSIQQWAPGKVGGITQKDPSYPAIPAAKQTTPPYIYPQPVPKQVIKSAPTSVPHPTSIVPSPSTDLVSTRPPNTEETPLPRPFPSKPSKKVTELRGRVQRQRIADDYFLTEELNCIEEEEQKMLESLERLDGRLGYAPSDDHLISYRSKPRPRGILPDQEEVLVQDSVSRLSDMLEKRSEYGSDAGSVCSAPISGLRKIKSEIYSERLLTKVTVEDLKRERTHSSDSIKRPAVLATPGSYSQIKKIPIPSVGRPPLPGKRGPEVVVNPHVDLRAVFEDEEVE